MSTSFAAFSDESSHTASRFRSIAAVSLPVNIVLETQDYLSQILDSSNVNEFKWSDLTGARYRFCANKIIDYILDDIITNKGRIDVLIWDTHDERHDIPGRDDIQNYERMFFHLHKNLMERRKLGAIWHVRPDERTDLNWSDIQSCLEAVGNWKEYFSHPLLEELYSRHYHSIESFKEIDSEESQLIQVADLFAGMGAYTRKKPNVIKQLIKEDKRQEGLFNTSSDSINISNNDRERFKVIKHLYTKCRGRKLGVSLSKYGYLNTPNPNYSINFWHYKPQHHKDKAPTRNTSE